MAYGDSRADAIARVETLALRVLADRLEHGERIPELDALFTLASGSKAGVTMEEAADCGNFAPPSAVTRA